MKKEFTLVELMVVIGIIAILAGILLPVLNKSRDKAIQTECAGNLGQLAKAEFAYAADSNNQFAASFHHDSSKGNSYWVNDLYPYLKESRVFTCGADENEDVKDDFENTIENIGNFCVSYLANGGVLSGKKRYLCESPSRTMTFAPRKHKDKNTTAKLGNCTSEQSLDSPLGYTVSGSFSTANFDMEFSGEMLGRHDQVSNFVFVDGHTASMTTKAFDNEKTSLWLKLD